MLSYAFLEPILIVTLLNVVMTLGLYITALSGQLSAATAAIAGVAGYGTAVLTVKFNVPFYPSIVVAALGASLIGAFLAFVTIRMRDFLLKLTTLAFGETLSVLAYNFDYIGGANSFTGLPLRTTLILCLLALAIAFYITWRFDGSRLGFASRAVRDDPLAATAMGVSLLETRVTTFTLGSAIVGLGGALQAHYILVVTPSDLGFLVSINFVIFLLFGGLQSMGGAVVGAMLLTALPEFLRFTNEFRLILYGLIITLVVLLRPSGLIIRTPTGQEGRFSRLWASIRPRRTVSAEATGTRSAILKKDELA